eukprot:CAMPEP_0118959846 /NCGR_PEP_ID=MMETSP1169-20130426/63335_1 /TAXON_ID=36882 /ORGANISM="Pyramimonas obovata, Strain CCMP722" /LENGTH=248 /DNA_ID=CAMNT_0006907987 /DNA_START=63 /DNA_END=809 /DNA_ORIENTATION=-
MATSHVSLRGGLVALSHRKIHSAKAVRGRRSVVTRAADEEEEIPKTFVPRRLTPLPSDFGSSGSSSSQTKNAGSRLPPPPADLFSDDKRPKDQVSSPFAAANTPPAASPFAAANKPDAPPASPFAAANSPAKPAASPFANASKPNPSPFANASDKPAASPFAAPGQKLEPNPFGDSSSSPFSAADIASSMKPIEKKPDMSDKSLFEQIGAMLPSRNQLFLVFTFGSIIALMLATTYVVVALGGVRLND